MGGGFGGQQGYQNPWTGGTGPGPGWGGPGWGYQQQAPWGAPPPAPQPGVIPLRPLQFNDLARGGFGTYRRYWQSILGVSALGYVLCYALAAVFCVLMYQLVLRHQAGFRAADPTSGQLLVMTASWAGTALVAFCLVFTGSVLCNGVTTLATGRAVIGTRYTMAEAWGELRPVFWRLLAGILLVDLAVVGTVLLCLLPGWLSLLTSSSGLQVLLFVLGGLGGIVLAVMLANRWRFASVAIVLEHQRPLAAMRRSAQLVTGTWWRVFGLSLLIGFVFTMVSRVITTPISYIAFAVGGAFQPASDDGTSDTVSTTAIVAMVVILLCGMLVAQLVAGPLIVATSALLYIDLRIRKESLDLQLAESAGVSLVPAANTPGYPGYGYQNPPWAPPRRH